MINRVFNILEKAPVLSIVLTFLLLVFSIYLFRKTIATYIVAYIKKKYGLFTEDEVRTAISLTHTGYIKNMKMGAYSTPNYNEYENKVITTLKDVING